MGKKGEEKQQPEKPVITDKNVLFYNAIRTNNPSAAQKLLKEHKIDVNYTLNREETLLFVAAGEGFTDSVQLLLEQAEIDVNKGFAGKLAPLYAACRGGYIDVVDLLLAKGGHSEQSLNAALGVCLRIPGRNEIMEKLIQQQFACSPENISLLVQANQAELLHHLLAINDVDLTKLNGVDDRYANVETLGVLVLHGYPLEKIAEKLHEEVNRVVSQRAGATKSARKD